MKKFKPNEYEFRYLYYNNSNTNLGEYYKVDRQVISKYARSLNLPSKKELNKIEKDLNNTKIIIRKDYLSFNENYFEYIDTYQKSYFLGLIASDGCVHKPKDGQCQLSIILNKEDYYILDVLREEISLKRKLVFNNKNNTVHFRVCSNKIISDLNKYGITFNKTWNMNLKNIPKEFIPSFLLGYFDGDGTIYVQNKKLKHRPSKWSVEICGASTSIDAILLMIEALNIPTPMVRIDNRHEYKYIFKEIIFKNSIEKYCFLKLIYFNDIMCLDRKKDKSNELIKLIEENKTNRSENKLAIEYYNKCRLY